VTFGRRSAIIVGNKLWNGKMVIPGRPYICVFVHASIFTTEKSNRL